MAFVPLPPPDNRHDETEIFTFTGRLLLEKISDFLSIFQASFFCIAFVYSSAKKEVIWLTS
jgi:hypothetical protein